MREFLPGVTRAKEVCGSTRLGAVERRAIRASGLAHGCAGDTDLVGWGLPFLRGGYVADCPLSPRWRCQDFPIREPARRGSVRNPHRVYGSTVQVDVMAVPQPLDRSATWPAARRPLGSRACCSPKRAVPPTSTPRWHRRPRRASSCRPASRSPFRAVRSSRRPPRGNCRRRPAGSSGSGWAPRFARMWCGGTAWRSSVPARGCAITCWR